MKKRTITKQSLAELEKVMPIVPEWEMRFMVGGIGSGVAGIEYTVTDFCAMFNSGTWSSGGYVEGVGYIDGTGCAESDGTLLSGIQKNGLWNSYYIGPTSNSVLDKRPTPTHAADYIAMLHDLDYQKLGLNGVTGAVNSMSRNADDLLIERCEELINASKLGKQIYSGYVITSEALSAAKAMRLVFKVEQFITGMVQ